MRAWWLAGIVVVAGCGGGDAKTAPPIDPASVRVPDDAPAVVARLGELHGGMAAAIAEGKDLPALRPTAEEIAVVARRLREVAARGYAPDLVAKLGTRGDEIAEEATNLATACKKGDAERARVVHPAIGKLLERLKLDLPRPKPKEDE